MMRLNPLWIAVLLLVLAGCDAIQPPVPVPAPTATRLEDPVVDELEATPAEGDVEPTVAATVTITATAAPTTTVVATLTPTTTATVTATPPITGTPTVTVTPPLTGTPPVTATPPITGTPTVTVTPPGTPTLPTTPSPTTPSPTTPTITPSPATPTATSPPTTPTATPLPATISLHKHRSFIDGANRIVVGEVINGARAPVFSVRVIATFHDADNRLVAAQETLAMLPQTQSRQTNPFRIVLANAPANIDHYELSLAWDDISLVEYDRLSIVSEEVVDENGVQIVGEARNDHRLGLRDLRVIATFYNAEGEIVDAFMGEMGALQLAPDETTTFAVRTGTPDLSFDSFLVQTQGVLER